MKKLLRHFFETLIALYIVVNLTHGLQFLGGTNTFLIATVYLTLVSFVAKPVINLLLLPLNLITFGLFRWVGAAIVIYLTTLLVPSFKVTSFLFAGFNSKWLDIPRIDLNGIWAYIGFSFLFSVIISFFNWLNKN